jgi:hypothetical protein
MTWAELDEKLREGVQDEVNEITKKKTHRALEKALVDSLPASFEVPATMLEEVTKERFAGMLGDMRERGTTDAKLKELITPENYEKYAAISKPSTEAQVKSDLALKEVGIKEGLVVPQAEVDDQVMTLQAQTLQRGEKFKESEVRPRVENELQRRMILDFLESGASVTLVGEKEFDPAEVLGASPEELAASVMAAEGKQQAAPAAAEPVMEAKPEPEPAPAPAAAAEEPAADGAPASSPDGFEWGGTF